MKVLNFGSLNLDYICRVPHFVRPGETLHMLSRTVRCGGKGLNQSVALARAGVKVCHAGCAGEGGGPLVRALEDEGVDTTRIFRVPEPQGSAVIEVDDSGENRILVFAGSNRAVGPRHIEDALRDFGPGDVLVLQNEISGLGEIAGRAHAKGMRIVLNPSPMDDGVRRLDLGQLEWLIVNELEARQISGAPDAPSAWRALHEAYPALRLVVTQGARGAVCFAPGGTWRTDAFPAAAVDTTGAGDTFTGYFLAGILAGLGPQQSLRRAACASAIAVTRPGAADAIPRAREVDLALRAHTTSEQGRTTV